MAARLTLAGAVALALAARDAGAETRPAYGGDLIATLSSEPASIDPAAARSHAEVTLAGLVFDTLYRTTGDGRVVPHLAAGLPEPDGAGRLRVALRPQIRFHDGSALDADDVVASLERLDRGGAGWLLAPVSAIAASGGEVVLTSDAAPALLAALLAAPQAAITPGGKAPRGATPVGSGPFRVEAIDRKKDRVVLTAFDEHVGGRPFLDRVELRWYDAGDAEPRAFEDGKLHASIRGATVFAGAQPKYRADVVEGPATLLTYLGFGRAHAAITGDVDFRRALHLMIARAGMASSGRGERVAPAGEPLPVELGGVAIGEAAGRGDATAAAAALERAAERVPALASSRRGALALEVLVDRTRLDDREIAERVVRALDKLGIAATITELAADDFAARVGKGDGDLWIGQLAAAGAAPALLWTAAFGAGGDDWAARKLAGGALDAGKARAEFAARLPIVPLLHRAVRVHHRGDVRGVALDASARIGFADLFFFGEPVRSKRKR